MMRLVRDRRQRTFIRSRLVPACTLMLATSALSTSCGSTAAIHSSSVTGLHSYMSAGANSVYWMQLKVTNQVEGVFEEVLGPGASTDQHIHDYVYHLDGSLTGDVMTYHLDAVSSGAPAFPPSMRSRVTARSVILGTPFPRALGLVMAEASQKDYDTVARAHVSAWTEEQSVSQP
jgi:hypothetical protein